MFKKYYEKVIFFIKRQFRSKHGNKVIDSLFNEAIKGIDDLQFINLSSKTDRKESRIKIIDGDDEGRVGYRLEPHTCIEVNDDGFWTMVLLDGETRPVLYKVESLQQIYPFKISIEKEGKISIG